MPAFMTRPTSCPRTAVQIPGGGSDFWYGPVRGPGLRRGCDHQAGPRTPNRPPHRGRGWRRADSLRGQEVRHHYGPGWVEGTARLRPGGGRGRGAHPGPPRPDGARHAEPGPRPFRAGHRAQEPGRPGPGRLDGPSPTRWPNLRGYCWRFLPRWNGPTPSSEPRTPGRWRRPRAVE